MKQNIIQCLMKTLNLILTNTVMPQFRLQTYILSSTENKVDLGLFQRNHYPKFLVA